MNNQPTTRRRSIAAFLIRARFLILAAACGLVGLAFGPAGRLAFDQSIESLYASDDPHLTAFLESKQWFGGDEFAIVAWDQPNLFDEQGFLDIDQAEAIREFSEALNQVPGVQPDSTQNLADAFEPPALNKVLEETLSFPPFRAVARMAIRQRQPQYRELVEGLLVGSDSKTTAIVLRLQDEAGAPIPRSETIKRIRALADHHPRAAVVAGEPVQIHDMFRLVEQDGHTLFLVSLGVLILVIAGCFFLSLLLRDSRNARERETPIPRWRLWGSALLRSLWWSILPIALVIATVTWTRALLVISDVKLSMVSAMLNAIVTIVGVATAIHALVRYQRHRYDGLTRGESWTVAFGELAAPIFWACATTAVGFSALLSSQITPVRSFGLMMSLAVGLVILACLTILPGGMLPVPLKRSPDRASVVPIKIRPLIWMTVWVERHPLLLVGGFAAVFALGIAGLFRLEVETDFSKNFRAESEISRALQFIEHRLGGAGTWEVNFPIGEELSDEDLDHIRKLASRLRTEVVRDGEPQLTKVIAMTDGIDSIPSVRGFTSPREMLRQLQPEYEPSLYNAETGRMRIMLRAYEQQPSETKLELIDQVERIADEEFPGAQTTGLFVLLTFLIESLLRDQIVSFAIAAAGIGTMMTLAFRSFRIGLISLFPNVFPIVLVIGAIGWIGLPVNIATAMIASVSMGLTVDSSIHYISGYQLARQSGASVSEAIFQTHSGVGSALLFSNLALIIGFSVLTLSNFIPLVYFGVLVSVAILGGLIGNLLLLPVLLRWVDRPANEGRG